MGDINVGNERVQVARILRVQKAKKELQQLCKKYDVSIYVDPKIEIRAEAKIPRSKERATRAVKRTRKKMEKLFKRYGTYMQINPSVELHSADKHTMVVPEVK